MRKYLVPLMIVVLSGCASSPGQEPLDWSGMQSAIEKHNANTPKPAPPKQTNCTTVGNRTNCTTY